MLSHSGQIESTIITTIQILHKVPVIEIKLKKQTQ